MSSIKPGDWFCRKCGAHNFASRKECKTFNCNEWRPLSSIPKKSGDWDCPTCKAVVFASKDKCFKCKTSKPNNNDTNSQSVNRQPGDWDCPGCKYLNFGTRNVCGKCGKSRDNNNNNNDNDDDDGNCVICLDETATHAPSGCGHLSMCEECGKNVSNCPMCRREFSPLELIKIFQC